jgi:hypothetical protein
LDNALAAPRPGASSNRLRTWLIILTIAAGLALIAAIPAALFGTYMAAFAADAPGTPADAVVNLMLAVWGVSAGYIVLLIAGVAGGWIAYRKRRQRLSFGLSLLAGVPMALVLLTILAFVVYSVILTAIVSIR